MISNISTATLAAALLLSAVGMASGSVLEDFGNVSGDFSVDPQIQLREVQYNPTNDDTEEFIRLKNVGEGPINLSGWNISDEDGSDILTRYNSSYSTVVGSEESAYITDDDSTLNISLGENRLSAGNAIANAGLNNDGENIRINYVDGREVDSVNYTGASCSESKTYQRSSFDEDWDCEESSLGGSQ